MCGVIANGLLSDGYEKKNIKMFKWVAKYTATYVNINGRERTEGGGAALKIENEYVTVLIEWWAATNTYTYEKPCK